MFVCCSVRSGLCLVGWRTVHLLFCPVCGYILILSALLALVFGNCLKKIFFRMSVSCVRVALKMQGHRAWASRTPVQLVFFVGCTTSCRHE